jgi:hypothetical protein
MRFLGFLLLLLILFAGVGLYRGWFHVGWNSSDDSSKVTVTLDKDHMRSDETTAGNEVKSLGHNANNDATTVPAQK